jgi:hypothetical protein
VIGIASDGDVRRVPILDWPRPSAVARCLAFQRKARGRRRDRRHVSDNLAFACNRSWWTCEVACPVGFGSTVVSEELPNMFANLV